MDTYISLFIIGILLIIAFYTLYNDASAWNLASSFFLLCFISYMTIYIVDVQE